MASAGYRFRPAPANWRIAPVFGAALGYGWATIRNAYLSHDEILVYHPLDIAIMNQHDSASRTWRHSLAEWDGHVEMGVTVRLNNSMYLLALSQLHLQISEFNRGAWNDDVIFSGALQLRYTYGQ